MESIINHLSNEDYHNGKEYEDFWSSTQMKHYADSPKRAYYKKYKTENKSTPAMRWGTLIHDYLEAQIKGLNFEEKHEIFSPPINASTGNPYGVTSAKYIAELSMYENPITQAELNQLKMIYYSMTNSGQFRLIEHLISKGTPETSKFLDKDGIKLKIRPDLETKSKIIDWKSIRSDSFTLDGIQRQIQNMNYGFSAAMYQWVTFQIEGVWKKFYWIFIESEAPFDFLIVDAAPYAYEIVKDGDLEMSIPAVDAMNFKKVLEQHTYALEKERWNGLDTLVKPDFMGQRIAKIKPNGFYINKSVEFYNKKS